MRYVCEEMDNTRPDAKRGVWMDGWEDFTGTKMSRPVWYRVIPCTLAVRMFPENSLTPYPPVQRVVETLVLSTLGYMDTFHTLFFAPSPALAVYLVPCT